MKFFAKLGEIFGVNAHSQKFTHSYVVHFPEHGPRPDDPHYVDFEAYKRKYKPTAKCYVGQRLGFQYCKGDLELHHSHVEFSLTNGVSFKALAVDYPGIDDPTKVGAWVESDQNFQWLCTFHHRSSQAGVHSIDHATWEASLYVPGLLG